MDTDRFAALLRSLVTASSRRATRRLLPGSALAGLLSLSAGPTEAHRRRNPCRGQANETPCGVGKRCCNRSCVDVLRSAQHCSTCATVCQSGEVCVGGNCCVEGTSCTFAPAGGTCGPPPAGWTFPEPRCQGDRPCTGGLCPC